MRAVLCTEHGPIEGLAVQQVETPPLLPGSVRIGLHYASLNGPDLLMPLGEYQVRPPLPYVLGLEGMGEVIECGPGVDDLKVGERVMTYAGHGCFAEEAVVPRASVFRVPEPLDDIAASGFTLVYQTAWHALVDCGRLQAGETVVITGAAGGIGLAAIQIAKALGARVLAVATGKAKLDACRAEGADALVDAAGDVRAQVREATGAKGVDVVLDSVGGDLTEVLLRSLSPFGRLLIVGYASRSMPMIKGNLVLLKQAQVIGVSYRLMAEKNPPAAVRNMEALARWAKSGDLRPRTCATYPLDEIVQALQVMSRRESVGKICIAIRPSP